MKQLTQSQKDQWVEALESGNYKQGKYRLRTKDNKYCCLGVLCEINPDLFNRKYNELNNDFYYNNANAYCASQNGDGLILDMKIQNQLSNMNDNNKTFKEIAAWIKDDSNVPVSS